MPPSDPHLYKLRINNAVPTIDGGVKIFGELVAVEDALQIHLPIVVDVEKPDVKWLESTRFKLAAKRGDDALDLLRKARPFMDHRAECETFCNGPCTCDYETVALDVRRELDDDFKQRKRGQRA